MANSRSRKSAPTRPGTSRDQRPKTSGTGSTSRTAGAADDPTESAEDAERPAAPAVKRTAKATSAGSAKATGSAKAAAATTNKTTVAAKKTTKKSASTKAASGSTGKRFGDGAAATGARKGMAATKSSGRGGRGGRPAPPVRVGQPKPWGMIAATVAVVLFAGAAIGYAVVQANSTAIPDSPEDIEGIATAEYVSESHVATDQTYPEAPPIGGLHDSEWADCDGTAYDEPIRAENAVHSLEHGAVWITYDPDEISDADLSVLSEYVVDQSYIMMSPYPGQASLVSLQAWNNQLAVDSVDDPRINEFIQVLRQNPETTPEAGASCTSPMFLNDPLTEGDQSRSAADPAAVPAVPTP